MKCEICGQEVEKKAFWQKYCSGTCRQMAWALRQLEKRNKAKEVKHE